MLLFIVLFSGNDVFMIDVLEILIVCVFDRKCGGLLFIFWILMCMVIFLKKSLIVVWVMIFNGSIYVLVNL